MIRAVVDLSDNCKKYSKRANSRDDGLSGVRSDIETLKRRSPTNSGAVPIKKQREVYSHFYRDSMTACNSASEYV